MMVKYQKAKIVEKSCKHCGSTTAPLKPVAPGVYVCENGATCSPPKKADA